MTNDTSSIQWYIALCASYTGLSVTLFKNKEIVDSVEQQDKRASSHLIPTLDKLFAQHGLALSDISFIAVDKGPGAFTALRVTIASINGIALARNIPLVGIDGLNALAYEFQESKTTEENSSGDQFLLLLNAYNNDCYYLLHTINPATGKILILDKGCAHIESILELVQNQSQHTITHLAGNGVTLHKELITQTLGSDGIIHLNAPQVASSKLVGKLAYEKQHTAVFKITPNYMKTQQFSMK